ncbi:MAG: NHLP family bacteriocin export ABC transporter peptidase/permease/ATPase subunit [Deltaproteobacteria bacterium]|nr:NHLP family bacteriocin export ABC transporter peptidase/permease/ATPase subunit [Deltaproteobacteria bacterium]
MGKLSKTPTVLQMEATECGAASLAMILAFHGRWVALEELRYECGVSRDGSKASNILKAARKYNVEAKGFKKTVEKLEEEQQFPTIVHWNFNHFLVLEGFFKRRGEVYAQLNDPASGRRTVSRQEFSECFTGVMLWFTKTPEFVPGGERPSTVQRLTSRIRGSEAAVLFLFLASLMLVLPGLVVPTLSRTFVDDVLIAGKSDWLRPLLLGLGLTAAVRATLSWLEKAVLLRLYTRLTVRESSRFFWHVMRLPVPFFLARYAGDIGARVQANDHVAKLLSGRLATTGLDLVMIVFFGTLMLMYDPLLTVIGISIAGMNLAVLRFVARKRADENQRLQQEMGKLIGVSMGGIQVIETLKASGAESDFFTQWSGYFAKSQNSVQALGRTSLLLSSAPALFSALNQAAILGVGGLRVIEGDMTIGMLVAFQSLMASFLGPVDSLLSLGSELQEIEADVKRLDDVLAHETVDKPDLPLPSDKKATKLTGTLELKSISFGYAPHAPPLISDFSLTLEPGSRVALVGGSGSGKSTVSKLVAGLYGTWSGEILFDGKPRQEVPAAVMESSLAMVDQDIMVFDGTFRDNITLWDPSIPDEDIIAAAEDAYIHAEIAAREGGYEAKTDGRNMSGGQRQRLEIARALAKNPTILILDEATSALDPLSEKIIDDNLRRRGTTCLIVAHRLSTIRDADEIIVLDQGLVVERGTHSELMKLQGKYAGLMGAT